MADISKLSPRSGRLIGEDGKVYNKVDLLGGAAPIGSKVVDIAKLAAQSGRIIGEDGKIYNEVDLLNGLNDKMDNIESEVEDLSKLTKWLGITTTPITENSTVNPIMISGVSTYAEAGNITQYGNDKFKFADVGTWQIYDDKTDVYTKDEVDALLDDKVDKVQGKGLSTNDFTNAYKNKVDGSEALLKDNAPKNLLYYSLDDLREANTDGEWGTTSGHRTNYTVGNATFTIETNAANIVESISTGQAMIFESGAEIIYAVKSLPISAGSYTLSAQIDDATPSDAKMYWTVENVGGSVIDLGSVTLESGYNSIDITVSAEQEEYYLTVYYTIGVQGMTPVEPKFGTLGTVQTMLRYAAVTDSSFEVSYRTQKELDADLTQAESDIDTVEGNLANKLEESIVDVTTLPTGSAIKDVIYRLATTSGGVTTYTLYVGDSVNQTVEEFETSGGVSDYTDLTNKPSINNVTLTGNKTLSELGISGHDNYTKTTLFSGVLNTGGSTITLAESVENFDALIVELSTSSPQGADFRANCGTMLIPTDEIKYEDTFSYVQSISWGTIRGAVRYCFIDSTTFKLRDRYTGNNEWDVAVSKIDGITFGARKPYKETVIWTNTNISGNPVPNDVALTDSLSNYDALFVNAGILSNNVFASASIGIIPISEIVTGGEFLWEYDAQYFGVNYIDDTHIHLGGVPTGGRTIAYKEVIGISYGGSVKGRHIDTLYTASDTTVPSAVTLSQAYTNYDELYLIGKSSSGAVQTEESYLTNGLMTGDNLRLLVTGSIRVVYSIVDGTTLSAVSSSGDVYLYKIYGIKYDSDYITIDSEMSSTSENPVQNKVVKSALDTKVDAVTGKGLSTNDYTTDEKTKLATVEANANVNAESVTWAALKSLRDDGELVTGKQYRITDFVTTVGSVQDDIQSAGNAFDIIVVADSASVLNENARAIHHSTGSSDYFYGQTLAAWRLKYDIENNTDKYAWADSTNGKGVIYELEDEYGNKAGYDFKNIQMKFYKITATTNKATDLVNTYSASRLAGVPNGNLIPSGFTIDSNDFEWRYTFDYTSSTHYDYSLNKYNSNAKYCYENIIPPLFGNAYDAYKYRRYINIISFRNTSYTSSMFGNEFGERNYNMSFGNSCSSNSFGNNCSSNSFGNNCSSNSFGNNCYYNSFGNSCYSNSFGNNCYYNSFGNNCYYNSFGNNCYSNSFGNSCSYNSFGNNCYYNSFGNSCYYNSFGNSCSSNSFGNNCYYNSFGNSCYYNSFGNSCYSNSFGNSCYYNSFGNSCSSNSFGNNCYYNSFGNSCSYNIMNPGASYRELAAGTVLATVAGAILDVNYDYGSWIEEEDEDTGDTIVTGFEGAYLEIESYDDGAGGEFTGTAKITLLNRATDERVVVFEQAITTEDGSWIEEDIGGELTNPDGDNVYVIYELTGTGSCAGIYWHGSDNY